MTLELVTMTRDRAVRSAAFARNLSTRIWSRLASGTSHGQFPAGELPSWDDAELADSLNVVANLTAAESREFLASLYRVVHAYERSGDVNLLTQFAREARTTARLWARPDFREAARRAAKPVAPDAAVTAAELLAKLG